MNHISPFEGYNFNIIYNDDIIKELKSSSGWNEIGTKPNHIKCIFEYYVNDKFKLEIME